MGNDPDQGDVARDQGPTPAAHWLAEERYMGPKRRGREHILFLHVTGEVGDRKGAWGNKDHV